MVSILRFGRALLAVATSLFAVTAAWAKDENSMQIGLQLWSLRAEAKQNPIRALDLAAGFGVELVETAGTFSVPPAEYARALRERSLRAVSAHFSYQRLKDDFGGVLDEARTLGARYVIVPSLPHEDGVFDAVAIAVEFNRWGAEFKKHGIRFGYHPHGFEFRPFEGETRFDVLARMTRPEDVCFEMDVFWVALTGTDPVALLKKYSGRWELMHLKDLRRGVNVGVHTGRAPPTDKVPVGSGQFDWKAILNAAREGGVRYFFIEEEGVDPLVSIPASLAFLRGSRK